MHHGRMLDLTLYTAPERDIDEAALRGFCRQQAEDRLFLESMTLELKRDMTAKAVDAIGALANDDGGLVLIGVDENDPETVPGVRKRDHDRLVNMCSELLEPRFVPEIVVIPLAAADRVVLMVRVNAEDVPARPVLVRGVAYVRSPGRTSRALRDELLRLCARPDIGAFISGPGASTLGADFQPDRGPAENRVGARLRLVAAGAVWLRPRQRAGLALGTVLRHRLKEAVEHGDVAAFAAGPHAPGAELRWQVLLSNETRMSLIAPVARRFAPHHVLLSLDVRLDGSRLGYCVGVHVGDPGLPQEGPVLGAEDAVQGLLLVVAAVRVALPAAVEDHFREPVLARHDVQAWLWPEGGAVAAAIGLDRFPRDAENSVRVFELSASGSGPTDEGRPLVEGLAKMLMAEGLQAPEEVAAQLVDTASSRPVGGPWL